MPVIEPGARVAISQFVSLLGLTGIVSFGRLRGNHAMIPGVGGQIRLSEHGKRIVGGVGILNQWYTPVLNTALATWSETRFPSSYTSRMSISFWILITGTNAAWRNVFHVSPDTDSWRRHSLFINPSTTGMHICTDTTNRLNEFTNVPTLTTNAKTHVVFTWNGRERKTYYNAVLQNTTILDGDPLANDATVQIFSASSFTGYATGGFQIHKLWFYPITMTQAHITSVYNTEVSLV